MGNKLGAAKAKAGFGKKGYKPGAMITKMNKKKSMTAGSASGVGRLQKAKNAKFKIVN